MPAYLRRCATAFALVLAHLAAFVVAPAWACGCGAYIPDRAGAAVARERSLVAWDGTTEHIVMELGVDGTSGSAAWVMPVPAEATVSLADPAIFEALADLGRPRREYRDSWWPSFDWLLGAHRGGDAAGDRSGPGAVQVRERVRLGPFDVARLDADDPNAVHAWLEQEGFTPPPGLRQNLTPYLADSWQLVAVRLSASGKRPLGGSLQPLRLTFRSEQVVYPMRLSRSAKRPQSVQVHVLAPHRMDPATTPVPGTRPQLQFAGPVSSADPPAALGAYVAEGAFLTSWNDDIGRPELITSDYVFTRAATDRTYRQVYYVDRDRGAITGIALVTVLVLGIAAFVYVRVRRRRGQVAPVTSRR